MRLSFIFSLLSSGPSAKEDLSTIAHRAKVDDSLFRLDRFIKETDYAPIHVSILNFSQFADRDSTEPFDGTRDHELVEWLVEV
jgi:hypothetical protein